MYLLCYGYFIVFRKSDGEKVMLISNLFLVNPLLQVSICPGLHALQLFYTNTTLAGKCSCRIAQTCGLE